MTYLRIASLTGSLMACSPGASSVDTKDLIQGESQGDSQDFEDTVASSERATSSDNHADGLTAETVDTVGDEALEREAMSVASPEELQAIVTARAQVGENIGGLMLPSAAVHAEQHHTTMKRTNVSSPPMPERQQSLRG